jgi:hypothetical protein
MSTAIIALVSAIAGASIAAATSYILAVRREKADREKDERVTAIEVKRAARLIDVELSRAQALAALSIEKRYWVLDVELSTEAWQKHCGTIAPYLSDQDWHAVMIAFQAVENIKGAKALYLSGVLRDAPISDNLSEGVAPMLRDVTRGRDALTRLTSLKTAQAGNLANPIP